MIVDGDGRVALDGTSAPAGSSGVRITGDGVRVTGLEIHGFPGYGIHVAAGRGADDRVGAPAGGNFVHDNALGGIRVGDAAAAVGPATVQNNEVDSNCLTLA